MQLHFLDIFCLEYEGVNIGHDLKQVFDPVVALCLSQYNLRNKFLALDMLKSVIRNTLWVADSMLQAIFA